MKTALIACGALAREILSIVKKHSWPVDVVCIPALLHNRPQRIPQAVQTRISDLRQHYDRLIVVYGDCGTAGRLDKVLADENVERLAGPHCYEMYGEATFAQLMNEEPGTYFLTDYLLRSFDSLVIKGMGLDKHPDLREVYFKNYRRVVYLAQEDDPDLRERAEKAAQKLNLPLEVRQVGYGGLERRLIAFMTTRD
jgi:hypothetical protein